MEPIRTESRQKATYLPKEENNTSYPPDRTVLLIIDPVNDFLSEGGAAWELTKKTVQMHNVIENMQRAIANARVKGIQFFTVLWRIQKKIMRTNTCIKEAALTA